MSWVRRTIIVTAADAPLARALAAGLAGEAGAGMFTTPLSPSGSAPATHYISTGLIEPQFAALMADPAAMYAAAQQAGASVTLAQCQALVRDSTVQDMDAPIFDAQGQPLGTEGPFATMARLGLQMVQAPL